VRIMTSGDDFRAANENADGKDDGPSDQPDPPDTGESAVYMIEDSAGVRADRPECQW